MAVSKKDKLIKTLHELGFSGNSDKPVAVSLSEFFDGNDDETSLARTLDPHPSLEALYYHLQRFANENDVEIYVEIQEVDEDDDDLWPRADRVFVIGNAEPGALSELQANVMASGIDDLGEFDINDETFDSVKALWWD